MVMPLELVTSLTKIFPGIDYLAMGGVVTTRILRFGEIAQFDTGCTVFFHLSLQSVHETSQYRVRLKRTGE